MSYSLEGEAHRCLLSWIDISAGEMSNDIRSLAVLTCLQTSSSLPYSYLNEQE